MIIHHIGVLKWNTCHELSARYLKGHAIFWNNLRYPEYIVSFKFHQKMQQKQTQSRKHVRYQCQIQYKFTRTLILTCQHSLLDLLLRSPPSPLLIISKPFYYNLEQNQHIIGNTAVEDSGKGLEIIPWVAPVCTGWGRFEIELGREAYR